jgi:hypothetical protein
MQATTPILMDIDQHSALPFPQSLPEFQRLFPDDAACAEYLEKARWGDGFVCPHCGAAGEPFRIATRPGVLVCRKCRRPTGLTVGTIMERSHTPLSTWFWAAYLVTSHTPGMSAVQFQRQLGLSRYETAFQILHKLRAGMVRPDQDRIGGRASEHVEVDETWMGAMRGAFDWQSPPTEAPNRFVDLSTAPSLRGRWSSRTSGAVTPTCGSAATITTPLPNVEIPK